MAESGDDWTDKQFVLAWVEQNGSYLHAASDELKGDRDVVLAAVKQHGDALRYASEELKGDRDVVLVAMKQNGRALQLASDALKDDREIVMTAVIQNARALRFASDELKDDKDIVMASVKQVGTVLIFASNALRGDKDIVLAAVKQNGDALRYASKTMQNDKDINDAAELQLSSVRPASGKSKPRPQQIHNDSPSGDDQLDVTLQTNAIADILAMKELATPFVTGILGNWGSGKSFALRLIQQRLGKISNHDLTTYKSKDDIDLLYPYCGHLFIVKFNAWTFSKEELWPGLMYRILYDLNEQLDLEAHIRNFSEDMCMRGIDYVELRKELKTDNMKEAFKNYMKKAKKENPGEFSYDPTNDGKASKALIDILNNGYQNDIAKLPQKMKELEKLNAKIRRKHFLSSIKTMTEERFSEELRAFREKNPGDDDINNMLNNVNVLRRWTKLFLGGIHHSPISVVVILVSVVLFIVITILFQKDILFDDDNIVAMVTGFVAPFIAAVGGTINTIREARASLEKLGVTTAIAVGNQAAEEFEKAYLSGDMEEGKKEISDIRKLETEISATKNRTWLVEGDSLHEQVRKRLKASNYEDKLGVIHQAQVDLQMISRAMKACSIKVDKDPEKDPTNTSSCCEKISDYFAMNGCYFAMKGCCERISDYFAMRGCCERISDYFEMNGVLGGVIFAPLQIVSQLIWVGCGWIFNFFIWVLKRFSCVLFGKAELNESEDQESASTEVRFPRGKPRVVLFIDDIDRCPPEKAVDVIEALQLLLDSSDIFVAVVALDVRYVTRALEKKYDKVLIQDSEPSGIQYLQKIIQLPFSVPRMTKKSAKSYFKSQFAYNNKRKESKSENDGKTPVTEPTVVEPTVVEPTVAEPTVAEPTVAEPPVTTPPMPNPEKPAEDTAQDDYIVTAEATAFTEEDLEVITEAGTAANTNPRAGRLLANVFKILKLIWEQNKIEEPTREVKETILLLLSMSSSYPLLMGKVLADLETALAKPLESNDDVTLQVFVERCISNNKNDHWSSNILTEQNWGELTLMELGYDNVRLLRSFSFVGDWVQEIKIKSNSSSRTNDATT